MTEPTGPFLTIVATVALVISGAVLGYINPGLHPSAWGYALAGALGGFIAAVFARVAFVDVLLPLWRRRAAAPRLLWIGLQTACTLLGLSAGLTMTSPDMPRGVFVILETGTGFFLGLTLTVAWVLLFEFVRYTIPGWFRAVRRSA